ncbi:MAG: hypothetical protein R3174_02395 [Gammaproteobacteria bacterium]|nr:hypothetical protein [Gammaproteobacteria bacterium]
MQGLQGFFTAQGLQGLHGFFAAQGLQGLQAFFTAQGLHGLHGFLVAQGLQDASRMPDPPLRDFDSAHGFACVSANTKVGTVTVTMPPRIAAQSGLRLTWSGLKDCFMKSSSF